MAAKTPAKPPTLTKSTSSASSTGKQQKSILGFFAKASPASGAAAATSSAAATEPASSPCLKETSRAKTNSLQLSNRPARTKGLTTPIPSSDAIEPSSSQENQHEGTPREDATPRAKIPAITKTLVVGSSPSRKAKKAVNYAESSDDDDQDVFEALKVRRSRHRSRVAEPDDDDFDEGKAVEAEEYDEDMDVDDFIVSDDSDDKPKKRKRATKTPTARKRSQVSSPNPSATRAGEDDAEDDFGGADMDNIMADMPETSTAQQWRYDPKSVEPVKIRAAQAAKAKAAGAKQKAHTREPEERYSWLANIHDIDRNPPGHPEYNPSTVYVPPMAWNKFSPFEKQYWEVKQKLWDTIVFFKKGKFYELYENDATIGHQLFDLKLTDRVNMRMVGVPESSLEIWVNQFIAKGYKVARVEQMESALAKEMRERDTKKQDKIVRRELACILTGGTLVDAGMLQDDNATYCVAIKESVVDDHPIFGVSFVDAATGQFFISEFEDDVDLTKFETFVAQINPRELVIEKMKLSTKALRILKNNTSPTTIWNYFKTGSEFWEADMTRRELDCSGYFANKEDPDAEEVWPTVLAEARDKDVLMSSLGALVQYLRVLKIEQSLLSQGNFNVYSPIHRNGTLILDGQTLINLEIFSNTVNGGAEGTLFNLLNRCVTPFGKRLFKSWVCHPLCDIGKINERLDAVDMLNADRTLREQFSAQLTKMPDLERLISRVHAGACRPADFVKVLEGFEQIEYTMTLLGAFTGGKGIIDRLVSSMPDLSEPLAFWKTAFDRKRAREDKILIPAKGIEEEFDESHDRIEEIKDELNQLLEKKKAELKARTLKFTDVGKEIYQIEAPKAVKVPKDWQQMSATSSVKRYYFKELTTLVRQLQEAEETHSQLIRDVALRLFKRFDVDHDSWIQAIRIVAQLDCLVSLARSSSSLGEPSCRPVFVDEERTVVEFEELRHPCMISSVDDFIPNDVVLGGNSAKISLLTGANAAGKSTILRMSCIAVIMAQIGCYVPATSARLTPCDRIMSRLGANDNIFAAQSTFFVELSETKKILSEATPRSLVILDELGRGTSSYDGVAVAQAVLHHVATHIGCVGFFATHYHSLATEFENHPEIRAKRMQIDVDDAERRVTFLYKLEDGVAEGSFGMHCAAMCGIADRIIERAEVAARDWEHTSRLKESLDKAKQGCYIPLGVLSDVAALLDDAKGDDMTLKGMDVLMRAIEAL
ncbi:muts domain V-domain-containing protein [Microdochium trichocladiopsis]|uniref:DNA mismatch repair protein n=1 Tax=Microdochium trichocladiopsis TaxID=1682393 RepID=A0A9P9BHH1_9PEZI|nr:muts domain V-domain-containing protein [Microdochium trichocladiopsis]KAH7018479.1 muts domain V-domain-containing protein [Microdochium trichocladiopsis]